MYRLNMSEVLWIRENIPKYGRKTPLKQPKLEPMLKSRTKDVQPEILFINVRVYIRVFFFSFFNTEENIRRHERMFEV